MHQRVSQAHPLPVAFGKLADDSPAHFRQAALGDDGLDPLACAPTAQALEAGAEPQILLAPACRDERVVLRHVADAAAHFVRLGGNVQPRHAGRAGSRRNETGKNAHGGAFARAVGAEQADDFAALDRKGQARHGGVSRVALGQIFNLDHHGHFAPSKTGHPAHYRSLTSANSS